MTKKIGSILLIFILIISLVGCEKKIETGSISGFDKNRGVHFYVGTYNRKYSRRGSIQKKCRTFNKNMMENIF